jgi:SAM-dependent methyltransferase
MTLDELSTLLAAQKTPEELTDAIIINEQLISLCLLVTDVSTLESHQKLDAAFHSLIESSAFKSARASGVIPTQVDTLLLLFATAFEHSGGWGNIGTMLSYLPDSSIKKRLTAGKRFRRISNAITGYTAVFEPVMQQLKGATHEGEIDYSMPVIQVVLDYLHTASGQLATNYPDALAEFQALFLSDESQKRFPFLAHPIVLHAVNNPSFETVPLSVENGVLVTAEHPLLPTAQILATFDEHITQPIDNDQRTRYERPLGYHKDVIRNRILEYGRADFREPCRIVSPEASPADRVLLYCYSNLRKHFFTTRYVLGKIIRSLSKQLQPGARPVFVDLGCGPLTAGLALADLHQEEFGSPLITHYVGIDIAPAMLDKAREFSRSPVFAPESTFSFFTNWHHSLDLLSDDLVQLTNPIILSASYLFASNSLEVESLALFVAELQRRCPRAPIYFVFQNPNRDDRNVNYTNWKKLLSGIELLESGATKVFYRTKPWATKWEPSSEEVYYELLTFQPSTFRS